MVTIKDITAISANIIQISRQHNENCTLNIEDDNY